MSQTARRHYLEAQKQIKTEDVEEENLESINKYRFFQGHGKLT